MYLVKYRDYIKDGISICGFRFLETAEWEAFKKKVNDYFKSNDLFVFKVNPEINIIYSNPKEMLEKFTIEHVSSTEKGILNDLLGTYYGEMPELS